MQVSGLSEIISVTCISAIWDQHPVSWFLASLLPPASWCSLWGSKGHLTATASWALLSPGGGWGGPPGSEIHIWRPEIADDCDILLYWHGRSYFISHILDWLTLSNTAFSMRPTLTIYLELQLYFHTCIQLMFLYFITFVTHTHNFLIYHLYIVCFPLRM